MLGDRDIRFGYAGLDGLDGLEAATEIRFDRAPSVLQMKAEQQRRPAPAAPASVSQGGGSGPLDPQPIVDAAFDVSLTPGDSWQLTVTVQPRPVGGPPVSAVGRDASDRALIETDHGALNRSIQRSLVDLDALQTTFPHGAIPAAGIPWFVAPFGRDSLIVGLQTFHVCPERAAGTLRVLAALQGTRVDEWTEEEPGKILHELRYGEMARLHEVPHSPYYGAVDATPLFLWLLAETVAWTGDRALYDDLLPNARLALKWIDEFGDINGDGLVEYVTNRSGLARITHQVWKDSRDSAHHADGSVPRGPIAAVEVHGYAYAGCRRLADVAEWAGDLALAAELRQRAEFVRATVEERFWLDDRGFYAQGLDGDKRPIAQLTSNPGHLLMAGLPAPGRARRVISRLFEPDMWSGWGVRTLSSQEVAFNPMSYHNGSIWPHDISLIGEGCFRYGDVAAGQAILLALHEAATSDPIHRLPELFCGFERGEGLDQAPVPYPVSCSPQGMGGGLARAADSSDAGIGGRSPGRHPPCRPTLAGGNRPCPDRQSVRARDAGLDDSRACRSCVPDRGEGASGRAALTGMIAATREATG